MRPALLSVLFNCMLASSAYAHIELLEPVARYPLSISGANKACPCGVGLSNRLCDVEGDRSDPDRSVDRVTTLTAGSTIIVRFDEYVGHSGRYRVAIDFDGADLEDFNANILVDIPDPGGNTGNVGDGSIWEIEVPLPDTVCDNCTIQLIQMMDGNTTDPVPDPIGRSSYYTCADVVLVAGNGAPDAGPGNDAGGGSDAGIGGDGDGGGCCHAGHSPAPVWSAFATLGMLFVLGRRTRKRRSATRR